MLCNLEVSDRCQSTAFSSVRTAIDRDPRKRRRDEEEVAVLEGYARRSPSVSVSRSGFDSNHLGGMMVGIRCRPWRR
jgi:hypothetical protein